MRTTRSLAVLAGTAFSIVALALPASAHVTVHSGDAVSGGDDAEITFRVPNEEAKLTTTKVVIALPADKPIAGVYAENKPGWKAAVTSVTLKTPIETDDGKITTAVSQIVWTATGTGTPVGGYDDFTIAAGHLPDTDSIGFKALQTYSDGTLVRWIEGSDGEHPAPVLALTAADPTASPSPTVSVSAAPVATVKASSDDSTGKALGGAGLGLGAVALLVGIGAFVRSGKRA